MKIYIAGSFKDAENIDLFAKLLEADGHTITEKWWPRPYTVESIGEIHTQELKKLWDNLEWAEFMSKKETELSFKLDKAGVENCDVFVWYAPAPARKYNGATAEYGIAVGVNKPTLLLGELPTSVLYWILEVFDSMNQVANRIIELQNI